MAKSFFFHTGPTQRDDGRRVKLLLRRDGPGRRSRIRGDHVVRPGGPAGLYVSSVWQVSMDLT